MYFDNKGQASAEFIFITLIVLIIIGGLVSLISGTMDQSQAGDVGGARIIGEKIAETINTVYINGNGYSIDMDLRTMNTALSTNSNSFAFTATINSISGSNVVTMVTGASSVNIKLIPKNINGTTTLNNNNVYHVQNVNGTVQIS